MLTDFCKLHSASVCKGPLLVESVCLRMAEFIAWQLTQIFGQEKKGWFIPDLLCIWEVRQAMKMKPEMKSTAFTVELETDECFYVTDLFDDGWAQVCQWTNSPSPKKGLMMVVVVVVGEG